MEFALTYDENIYGLLRYFINDCYLIKYIMSIKKKLEYNDALEYYLHKWENICGFYFSGVDRLIVERSVSPFHAFPIIDTNFTFFYKTGISYQVIYLVFQLIEETNKNERKKKDKLFFHFCKNIMSVMNQYK